MPFWKQSEDPWDRKPGKPTPPKEPKADPLDTLKQWNEERKAKAKEQEEAKRLPPESCPWCGKEMEQGFLLTGGDPIRWYPGVYKTAWIMRDRAGSFRVDTEGDFALYKVAWLCRDCKKLTLAMPEPEEDIWSMDRYRYADPQAPEKPNEEESSED